MATISFNGTTTLQDRIQVLANQYEVSSSLAERIIWCESSASSTEIHINLGKDGKEWSRDIGYWQINDYYHSDEAKKFGFDISDPDQNLEYGFLIMQKYGLQPWLASKSCWGS